MRTNYYARVLTTALSAFFLVLVRDLITQLISSILSIAVYSVFLAVAKQMFSVNIQKVFTLANILLIGCAVLFTVILIRTIA
jgi:hypothetical protein